MNFIIWKTDSKMAHNRFLAISHSRSNPAQNSAICITSFTVFVFVILLWFYGLRFYRTRQKNPDWLHWKRVQGDAKKDCKYHCFWFIGFAIRYGSFLSMYLHRLSAVYSVVRANQFSKALSKQIPGTLGRLWTISNSTCCFSTSKDTHDLISSISFVLKVLKPRQPWPPGKQTTD